VIPTNTFRLLPKSQGIQSAVYLQILLFEYRMKSHFYANELDNHVSITKRKNIEENQKTADL
jgi:hypothetical protein